MESMHENGLEKVPKLINNVSNGKKHPLLGQMKVKAVFCKLTFV